MSRLFRGAVALLAVTFLTIVALPTGAHAGFIGCGDGSIQSGEGCDDGDSESFDGCSSSCLVEYEYPCNTSGPGLTGDASCETGICDQTETTPTCENANTCGNGHVEAFEGCDDGNTSPFDGCSDICLVETNNPCGADENGYTGDASCASTHCDQSQGSPGTCEGLNTCGNGLLEPGEGCDDGSIDGGDGCNSSCLVEDVYPCNTNDAGATGDASCNSGICDESNDTCQEVNYCPNTVCEIANDENCDTCPQDCGACPTTTSTTAEPTTTTTVPDTTTTTLATPDTTTTTLAAPETTTTTIATPDTTTTTIVVETTTTTLPATGACCTNSGCTDNTAQDYCTGELQGSWAGADTTCQEGACSVCGNSCQEPGEGCDDGDTDPGDGCDSNCQEEQCWQCGHLQGGPAVTSTTFPDIPSCQPSTCFRELDCAICGNGEIENGEQCDDGNTTSGAGDCCSATCQYVTGGTSCADSTFCDGAETCDGSGSCVSGTPPNCSELSSACTLGVCDPERDTCVADPGPKEGDECAASGACVNAGSGQCSNGLCVGSGTMLSPSCRWIICAGSPAGDVRVRTGRGSSLNANTCGDTAKWAGTTSASMVSILPTGEGVRFYGPPVVDGDIVTGGSSVRANLYLDIPGTSVKVIDTGMTMAKDPAGVVDTTGNHALVDVCSDDQDILAAAVPLLGALGNPDVEEGLPIKGLKIAVGGGYSIDRTGLGISIVDMDGLKVGHGATLTLSGNANDVIVLRIKGRLKFGYHSSLILDGGLVPEHVLLYSNNNKCRISPSVTGAGTVFCPESGRFKIGVGAKWTGTFLGGSREVQVRLGAVLTHAAFTGF